MSSTGGDAGDGLSTPSVSPSRRRGRRRLAPEGEGMAALGTGRSGQPADSGPSRRGGDTRAVTCEGTRRARGGSGKARQGEARRMELLDAVVH